MSDHSRSFLLCSITVKLIIFSFFKFNFYKIKKEEKIMHEFSKKKESLVNHARSKSFRLQIY